jgi:hypothetical protein
MNMMYQLIMAQKKAKEAALMSMLPGMKASQKYEYDSDEDDEGGTWEHKQRTSEMMATRGKNENTNREHQKCWQLELKMGTQTENIRNDGN